MLKSCSMNLTSLAIREELPTSRYERGAFGMALYIGPLPVAVLRTHRLPMQRAYSGGIPGVAVGQREFAGKYE